MSQTFPEFARRGAGVSFLPSKQLNSISFIAANSQTHPVFLQFSPRSGQFSTSFFPDPDRFGEELDQIWELSISQPRANFYWGLHKIAHTFGTLCCSILAKKTNKLVQKEHQNLNVSPQTITADLVRWSRAWSVQNIDNPASCWSTKLSLMKYCNNRELFLLQSVGLRHREHLHASLQVVFNSYQNFFTELFFINELWECFVIVMLVRWQ